MNELDKLRTAFQSKSQEERKAFLKSLNAKELKALYDHPDLFLFNKQIIPEGDWRYCILRCGRRFGKSVAGSAWLAKKIKEGHKHVALCGVSYGDVERTMVPALQSWFVPAERAKPSQKVGGYVFPNGAIVYCFTSDREERGTSISALWVDEIGSFCDSIPEKVKERFNILDTAVSVGRQPQTIITSTPKPFPLYFEWQKKIEAGHPGYKLITGNMDDNPFLSEAYKQAEREKYGSSRFGKQEYYGDLLTDTPGALWTYTMFDDIVVEPPSAYRRVVVAVDPAVTSTKKSDETGIIVAGLGVDGKVYIIDDLSGVYTPQQWAAKTVYAYNHHKADLIIAEKNMGGDLVASNIRTSGTNVPVKLIHASRGKIVRAEPVASLYERKLVYHLKDFPELIEQCCTYNGSNAQSPDRMDGLAYAVTELMLNTTFTSGDNRWIPQF